MKEIHSPLTRRANVEKITSYDVEEICRGWEEQFGLDVLNEFHGHKRIELFRCKDTDLLFFHPWDVLGSAELYAALQEFDWFYMRDKWEHQIALRDLSCCKSVLEIGSGTGSFVQSAMKLGLNIRGIELNPAAVAVAESKGLPIFMQSLQSAVEQYAGSMDGVCSFQVLEHVPDPADFIKAAIDLLKPGGVLIFSVPNSESFLKHQYCLLDMPPHHMTRWSAKAFSALTKIFPLEIQSVKNESLAACHINGYLDTYADHFRSNTSFGRLMFNRVTVPVYRVFLKMGLRRFLTGQTIYASFRKL